MEDGIVRVLLVEDDKIDRLAVQRMVDRNHLPYRLTTACSSTEARQWLADQPFDIVLLDYLLGDGTGLDLLDVTGEIPVIIVTGAGSEEIAVNAMRAGAYDYLIKDQEGKFLTVLPVTIESVLERRRAEDALAESEERYRGMAEFADSVIHNAGNVLSSVQTSCEVIRHKIRKTKLKQLRKAIALVAEGLEGRLSEEKAIHLPAYLATAVEILEKEQQATDGEIIEILEKLNLVKEIIRSQQDRRKAMSRVEELSLSELVEETLKILRPILQKSSISQSIELDNSIRVYTDRTTLAHVLINVIKNAAEAMVDAPEPRVMEIRSGRTELGTVQLSVTDSGVGIAAEDLEKLFKHGYTTKRRGHGFGLHYCAHAMNEMGGEVEVTSPGPGEGATVRLIMAARS